MGFNNFLRHLFSQCDTCHIRQVTSSTGFTTGFTGSCTQCHLGHVTWIRPLDWLEAALPVVAQVSILSLEAASDDKGILNKRLYPVNAMPDNKRKKETVSPYIKIKQSVLVYIQTGGTLLTSLPPYTWEDIRAKPKPDASTSKTEWEKVRWLFSPEGPGALTQVDPRSGTHPGVDPGFIFVIQVSSSHFNYLLVLFL